MITQEIKKLQTINAEIGMITFMESTDVRKRFLSTISDNYTPIGILELDALCINEGGELLLLDNEVENRIFCKAAKTQEDFLECMNHVKRHFEKCVEDERYYENENNALYVKKLCTRISGSQEYEGFYTTLIGI